MTSNTFNKHRAKVLADARKEAARSRSGAFDCYTGATFSMVVTRNWLATSYYQRKWELTPKNKRPNYLRPPWQRFFGYIN